MFRRREDELDPTDWSETTENLVVMDMESGDDASLDSLAQPLDTKKIDSSEESDGEAPHQHKDSRIRFFCKFCGKDFKSDKALGGHVRVHRQHRAKSKAGIHRMKSTSEPARKHYSPEEEEEDDSFVCFVCDDSFSSMKLLCEHMTSHRQMDSNGIHQRPIRSRESSSLSEPETETKTDFKVTVVVSPRNDHNEECCTDLVMKDIPTWSQTRKRGWQKTVSGKRLEDSQDFNYQSLLTKKHKTEEETMLNQDASLMEPDDSYKSDTESTIEVLGNSKQPTANKTPIMSHLLKSSPIPNNKSKSSSCSHARVKDPNRVYECEICGRTFQTGQALGGHKTYHRMKAVNVVDDPSPSGMGNNLVQRKAQQDYLCEESVGEVREYMTRMLLPGLSEEAADDPSQESYPKTLRLLGFDLNIPY
ncbi:hypothetical protein PTKIN_Ptkin11bG0088000 [Pterospermum kingtungense]